MTPYSHGGMACGLNSFMDGNYTLLICHIEISFDIKTLNFQNNFLPDACRPNLLEDPTCTLNNFQSQLQCLPMNRLDGMKLRI